MIISPDIFLKKKILVYGLGKSGISTYQFLKDKSNIFVYDDFSLNIIKDKKLKKKIISKKKILNFNFDKIILSPGIDINKCNLSKFLKKNKKKIYSDLDIFYAFYKNVSFTITGTNGKSTTCQLLYKVLLNQKFDVRLVGNIGNPILSTKKVTKNSIFIIEASSYQLEYSKIFKSKYSVILNLSPDHIERHGSLKKYIKAKFKLLINQNKGGFAFVKKDDILIKKELKSNNFKSKIIKVDTKKNNKIFKKVNNNYFLTENNKENLSFILEIVKKLKIQKNLLIKSLKDFKGLRYRQQIIFKNSKLTIINDSKSTSFSSSIGVLKVNPNIYWLIGGVYKEGDQFYLDKKYYKNIKAFIYGKNYKFFKKKLKGKVFCNNSRNIDEALKKVFLSIKKEKLQYNTILFSPAAASFDTFKNFEDRGLYFNKMIKKYINGK